MVDTSSARAYNSWWQVRSDAWSRLEEASGRLADAFGRGQPTEGLVLQQHFVVIGLSSLVMADPGAVLVAPAPAGPVPGCCAAAGDCGDQVCQETADLAERDWDEAAARAFGAVAAVTDR